MTLWTAACQAPLSLTVSRSLLKFMSVESVMPSNHLILSCILICAVFPSSQTGVSFIFYYLRESPGEPAACSCVFVYSCQPFQSIDS